MNKKPMVAFLLSFIPGLGHLYLGHIKRTFLYVVGFFGPLGLIGLFIIANPHDPGPEIILFILLVVAIIMAILNMADMIMSLLRQSPPYAHHPEPAPLTGSQRAEAAQHVHNERFYTIILSIIPGLPHFQLGLMQRGLTFIVGFFGLFAMISFVSFVTQEDGVFVFLLALPIIMFYGVFDAMQLLNRKQRGEEIVDRTIFEDLERNRETDRRSKTVALLLAVFPGAGHLYLGLQQRGLQLMAAFLVSVYLMDALRMSIFLYLIPIIWFLSLFDAMQIVSKPEGEVLKDVPFVKGLKNHQRWVGMTLVAIGLYYLLDSAILRLIQEAFPQWRISYWFDRYAQVILISVLFIAGGFKLMLGSKKNPVQEAGDTAQ